VLGASNCVGARNISKFHHKILAKSPVSSAVHNAMVYWLFLELWQWLSKKL